MTIKGDIWISDGTIVDPSRDFLGKGDLLIQNGKIIDVPPGEKAEAERTINAAGYLVLPGLIDYHTHVFPAGTDIGVHPDPAYLPQGITTVVDQGSTGVNNFDSFFNTSVTNSQIRIYACLHSSPAGLATLPRSMEPVDPKLYDVEGVRRLFGKYGGQLVGLKIRQTKEVVGEFGLAPLAATVKMAEAIGCRVVVHTTNPPGDVEELAALLRPGDVFTHVYQGKGSNIIDSAGKVRQAVRQARARGVIFDTADGRGHYAFSVAKAAIADGFEPDVISTDVVRASLYAGTVFGLPLIMSKYLNLGICLPNVVKASTLTPARLIGMDGKLGTLSPGACADVAIFQLKESSVMMEDVFGETLTLKQMFIPRMTILGGKVAYSSLEL